MSELTIRQAREMRKQVLAMHLRGSGVGSALSVVDVLSVLYFDVMRIESPADPLRDRFLLSKGHAAAALYAALALRGFFDLRELETFLCDGSPLTGHPGGHVPGVELPTGSLGHGLAVAAGMAMAARRDDRNVRDGRGHRAFVLMGDGELQEGSVWEAAMVAARLGLDNLVAILDVNELQGYGRVQDLLPLETLADKWASFGWAAQEADGHDHEALSVRLRAAPWKEGRPSVLIARTVLGKGVAEMEGQLGWHYFSVTPEKLPAYIEEVGRAR